MLDLTQGEVAILKDEEVKTFLKTFSCFGESSLGKNDTNNKRSATVRAQTEVECLSIGRKAFLTIFGNEMESIVTRNFLRRMFRDSPVFNNLNLVQMEKCINRLEKKVYAKDEVIIEANKPYSSVFFIIDRFSYGPTCHDNTNYQKVFNDIGFFNNIPIKYPESVIAVSNECTVMEISYKAIFDLLRSEDLSEVFAMNKALDQMFFKKAQFENSKDFSAMKFIKTLGKGGQGLVVLAEDKNGETSAVKVISKESVSTRIQMGSIKVGLAHPERVRHPRGRGFSLHCKA